MTDSRIMSTLGQLLYYYLIFMVRVLLCCVNCDGLGRLHTLPERSLSYIIRRAYALLISFYLSQIFPHSPRRELELNASSPPGVSLLPIFSLLSDVANIDSGTTYTTADSGFIYSFFIFLIFSVISTDNLSAVRGILIIEYTV